MIRELDIHEIAHVSGGGLLDIKFGLNNLSLRAHTNGAIWGALDGALTGLAIGGKWGGAGGFLFGGVAQLVGWVGSAIIGGAAGGAVGWIYGQPVVANLANSYRNAPALSGNPGH